MLPSLRFTPALVALGALALTACGGPPLKTKDEAAAGLTRASMPSTTAQGAALRLLQSQAASDFPGEAAFTLQGRKGGSATLKVNPVEVIVGLFGKGLLFDIEYSDYSDDGLYRLDGTLSLLAQYQYVAQQGEDPYSDLRLSMIGRMRLGGVYSDELDTRVTVVTRFHELAAHSGNVRVRVNGYVEASQGRFDFTQDDFNITWGEASQPK
ncbi:MAG TPA: hypothetical protein VK447_02225 [Myxococcaceae bacterium]|nr:hypothetical protein [Myxococcaceae bacterium]